METIDLNICMYVLFQNKIQKNSKNGKSKLKKKKKMN